MSPHGKCHLCDATCMQCKGPESEDCTSCPPTRFFDDGRCDIHCQAGRYAMGRQCHLCHHTCHECTDEGPDNCTSCDTDKFHEARYLFKGQCREVCPEGFFHSAWKRCEPCVADCTICTERDHCLRCSPGHKLKNGKCVPLECSTGEVAIAKNEDCLPCDEGCERCQHKDSAHHDQGTVCLKCEDGYYKLGTDCHQSCPDRTYSVNGSMVCEPCEDKRCVNCDQFQCYWCEERFYVFDGSCVDHCKEGFFVDKESQDCEPCHRACRTCGGPQYDDCDSCEEGFTLKNGECLEDKKLACPEKQFRNNLGKCAPCHFTCKTCSGTKECSSCYPGRFLTPQYSCLSRCSPGTFANKMSGRCEDCSEGCVMCQDAQQCQRCRDRLYLHDGACVEECPRGIPQGSVCQPCASECASCQKTTSHCLSCEKHYLLLDHSCRERCPESYYATERECLRCPDNCRECNKDGLCKKCADYFFLHDDKCVDDCPTGYFASEKQQECERCHADCASCDGPDIDDCLECRNKKAVRHNGECLAECLSYTYHDKTTNECRNCDKSCLTCSGPEPTSCLSCDKSRTKDATGHCVWFSACPLTSYMDQDGECQKCHKLCHRCSGPGKDHCLSCKEQHFLLNNTCVQECPVGYYAEDKDERVCERCHFTCKSCTGRHSVQCDVCKPGFFRQGSSCVETCLESHYGNFSNMACERCDPSCSKCWGPSNRNCRSCRDEYVYLRHSGQCLRSCPSGYYHDSWSKTCHRCHPTCKTCNRGGALACQSCHEGYTFMRGICESKCLLGFYAASQVSQSDEPNCKACDPSCLDCRGPSMWNCTVCPTLQILNDDGRCLSCCGKETRQDDKPIARECCDCQASLMECVLDVNFVLRGAEELEVQGSSAKRFITFCILLILSMGGGVFVFLQSRPYKSLAIPGMPKTKAGGYEKLDSNGGVGSQPDTSPFGEYSDRIIECEDDEGEEDDDIVYMSEDGTVYRKFKYGLLDDDEIELEYDDESFLYK